MNAQLSQGGYRDHEKRLVRIITTIQHHFQFGAEELDKPGLTLVDNRTADFIITNIFGGTGWVLGLSLAVCEVGPKPLLTELYIHLRLESCFMAED